MSKTVSIIVPVYNGANYLEYSISSVLAQDYDSIQLITINDGSSDNSEAVLHNLLDHAPSNITWTYIEQQNGGICAARNTGLDAAYGDYVMFMDQDDCLFPHYVATYVSEIEQRNTDFLIGGYELQDENHSCIRRYVYNPALPWFKYKNSAPWGRIYRKDIIDAHHIRFMITKISEDFYFNLVYMSYCNDIQTTSEVGYAWTIYNFSESHSGMSQISDDRNVLTMISQGLTDMNQANSLETDLVEYMIVKHLVWYLWFTAKSSPRDVHKSMHQQCFDWLEEHFPNALRNKQIGLFTPKGEEFRVKAVVSISLWLHKMHLLDAVFNLYHKV